MTADTTASPSGAEPRAFVLLKSRRRLDLLNPSPHAWTDDDLAAGLSRLTPSGRVYRRYPVRPSASAVLVGDSAPGLSKDGPASIDWMMSAQRAKAAIPLLARQTGQDIEIHAFGSDEHRQAPLIANSIISAKARRAPRWCRTSC